MYFWYVPCSSFHRFIGDDLAFLVPDDRDSHDTICYFLEGLLRLPLSSWTNSNWGHRYPQQPIGMFPLQPRSMFGDRTDFSFPGPNASRNRVTPFSILEIPIRHTPADVNLSSAPLVVVMIDFPYVYVHGFYVLLRYILKTYTRVREIRQKPL